MSPHPGLVNAPLNDYIISLLLFFPLVFLHGESFLPRDNWLSKLECHLLIRCTTARWVCCVAHPTAQGSVEAHVCSKRQQIFMVGKCRTNSRAPFPQYEKPGLTPLDAVNVGHEFPWCLCATQWQIFRWKLLHSCTFLTFWIKLSVERCCLGPQSMLSVDCMRPSGQNCKASKQTLNVFVNPSLKNKPRRPGVFSVVGSDYIVTLYFYIYETCLCLFGA